MRNQIILLSIFASLAVSGCKALECAEGTIERDGMCEAADESASPGRCGPFTELQGDRCVPQFPPTECDPTSTIPETDDATGVTICKGTGDAFGCPKGSSLTKQTVCGQLYSFVDDSVFGNANGMNCMLCDPANPTTSGPCALKLTAYAAVGFTMGQLIILPATKTDVDTCGRFRLQDIDTQAAGPFIGIGIDDATMPGPAGVTTITAVTVQTDGGNSTPGVEAFVAPGAVVAGWGNGLVTGGAYAAIFREHIAGPEDQFAGQDGVKIVYGAGSTEVVAGTNAFYFGANAAERTTIAAGATMTGINGTVLVNDATLMKSPYTGIGGLGTGCAWPVRNAATVSLMGAGVLFTQVFRKTGAGCAD